MFKKIFNNELSDEQTKKYLVKLYQDGETSQDIYEAAKYMREFSVKLPITNELQEQLIDNCGTGGDKSNSFNISTISSIVLSSCGCKVAKHGNRSITSKSGSADMLEQLGVNLNLSIEQQCIVLEKCGFVFMFAQNHHPCMKYIMPIRKSISHRTIFNILGPLVNPAGVKKQLIGVFDKKYIMKMAQALKKLGSKKVMVVSSKDNMDEISICDITYGAVLENGEINEFEIDPRTFGFDLACLDDIKGGDVKENAQIALDLLDGKTQGAKLNIILLNCAFALYIDEKVSKVEDGIKMAYDAIKNGKARQKLDEIIKITNSF